MVDQFFQFDIDTSQIDSYLGELTLRLQGLDPLYDTIAADIIQPFIDQRFDTETDPTGTPWAELKPETIRQRQRKGLVPIKKLNATGKGRKNIKVTAESGGVKVSYGDNDTDYMELHNTGTKRMAQRRFVPTPQEIESGEVGRQIQEAAESYLTPGLGRFVKGEIRRTKRILRG